MGFLAKFAKNVARFKSVFIEAEYEDGFVHREDEQDQSLFEAERNVFYDIVNRLLEPEHGKIVRFSIILLEKEQRIDVDFTKLPVNALPIRDMHMEADFSETFDDEGNSLGMQLVDKRCVGIDFGYKFDYLDVEGETQTFQEIQLLRPIEFQPELN